MRSRTSILIGLLLIATPASGSCDQNTGRLRAAVEADLVVVLNKADDTAALVNPQTLDVVGTISTGSGPHEVAISPDGKTAYVANYGRQTGGNTLSIIDLKDRKNVGTINLGQYTRPHGIVASKDGQRLYVTCEGSRAVVVVNIPERNVSHAIQTDQNVSHMIVVNPDETRAYVANIGSGTVTVIDLAKREVITHIPVGNGAEGIDISPDGKMVFVAARGANRLSLVDTATNTVVKHTQTSQFPIRVKVTPDGRRVLVSNAVAGSLQIFDAVTLDPVKEVQVGRAPVGLLIEPGGKRVYIARTQDDKVSVVDMTRWEVVGEIQPGDEPDGLGYARQ